MATLTDRLLFWFPRVLVMLFAAFLSVFAFDVFSEHRAAADTAFAFAMHLVPAALVVLALLIAWRWEWVGALLLFGLGATYLIWPPRFADASGKAVIAGPLFLTGALFLAGWLFRRQLHPRR